MTIWDKMHDVFADSFSWIAIKFSCHCHILLVTLVLKLQDSLYAVWLPMICIPFAPFCLTRFPFIDLEIISPTWSILNTSLIYKYISLI